MRVVTLILTGAAGWFVVAPGAAAEPFVPRTSSQPASSTIAELEAQGYDVQINWLTGYDTKPLSECRVTRVNDPGDVAPGDGAFVTVYVDVVCPNGDEGGFGFGVGVG